MSEPLNRQPNKRVANRQTGDYKDPMPAAKIRGPQGDQHTANVARPDGSPLDSHLTPPREWVAGPRGQKAPNSAKVPSSRPSGSKDKAQTGR